MKQLSWKIEAMSELDWPAVEAIYLEGIETGNATLETQSPGWERWNGAYHRFARLVARDSERILGWAAVSPVSIRKVYSGVAEVSVYIAGSARGTGIGRALLARLIEESEAHGIWTLQAGILRENVASLVLHGGCGFREVGVRERIGKLAGVWRDVILLERRSSVVGADSTA